LKKLMEEFLDVVVDYDDRDDFLVPFNSLIHYVAEKESNISNLDQEITKLQDKKQEIIDNLMLKV
jgi:hypothetical protein